MTVADSGTGPLKRLNVLIVIVEFTLCPGIAVTVPGLELSE